jgi:hypothetical protein
MQVKTAQPFAINRVIEIYDQEGALIGSAIVPMDYENMWRRWKWLNRPIQGYDFNTPAPEREEIAINLLRRGRQIDTIASTTGLSLEDIHQLQQQLYNRSQEFALHMLSRGAEIDIITRVTGLSLEEIEQLQQQIDNPSQD